MKWRKYFKRKREERKTLKELPAKIQEFNETLNAFNKHYSPENIKKRKRLKRLLLRSFRFFLPA